MKLDRPAVVVRAPSAAEVRACRMLLPEATGAVQRSRLYVATAGEPARVVGAAALGLDRRPAMQLDWQVDLRVIAPFRRQGIGRALLNHVIVQAGAHGIRAVHAWAWVEPDSEPARAWQAFGFAPFRRRMDFEADLVHSCSILVPLYDEVRAHGWIPNDARIVPLAEADAQAVARLHVEHLGGNLRLLLPLLRGPALDRYDPDLSRVLLVDGKVMGFTLGKVMPDGVCAFDANVLHPAVRLGWANVWLKVEAAQLLLSRGVTKVRYSTFARHTDTQRISRQVGAQLVRTLLQMRRELTPIPPSVPPPAAAGAGG